MAAFVFTVEADLAGPVITPLVPAADAVGVSALEHIKIRLTDEIAVNPLTVNIQVNGVPYVTLGVATGGAIYSAIANAFLGYDIELTLPAAMVSPGSQEVAIAVSDTTGNPSALTYRFFTGVGLRMLSVLNPREGVLVVRFNQAIVTPVAANWRIQAVSLDARELTVVGVDVDSHNPEIAILAYDGGGSIYRLTALGIVGQSGAVVEAGFNALEFEIFFGTPLPQSIQVFDTIYGPIGMAQRPVTRRTMDTTIVNRSIAIGMDEQFRLRLEAFGDGTAGRDGRIGGRRT